MALALLLAAPVAAIAGLNDDDDPFRGELGLSYVTTSGNAVVTTLSGDAELVWEQQNWRERLELTTLHVENEERVSAERYFASAQIDYKIDEYQYIFVHTDYEDDRFSGYKYRAGVSAGYGRRLFSFDQLVLDAEFGPGYRFAELLDGSQVVDDGNEAVLRLAGRYRYDFNPETYFRQELNTTFGDEVTITKSTSSLITSLLGQISLKVSYYVQHVTDPPDGVEPVDTRLTLGAVYGF